MSGVESYIGSPEQDIETGKWRAVLDSALQTNLDSISELVLMVFDARSCVLVANFSQGFIELSKRGESVDELDGLLTDKETKNQLSERIPCGTSEVDLLSLYQICAPIYLPSGLLFGSLVFDRYKKRFLSTKEKAILSVIQRDIANHFVQHKQVFETAKSIELHNLISKHNQDWIFVKDDSFRLVYANDAFLKVYPEEMRDKIIGFTTIEEYDDADAEVFLAQDKVAFAQGISTVHEELHMPDGRHIIVETVKRRFEDEYGKAYILCVCRNVTDREKLIKDLKKANKELDDFTGIASHDLRSPLNAIKRLLQWIEDDCAKLLPEEHLENLNLVINRADRMQVLLGDLLKYAKIDRNDIKAVEISLTDFYGDVVHLLDVPDTVTINMDEGTLMVPVVPFKTVMLNLIGNAIKHNDKEQGVVNVSFSTTRHYYVIEVSDNGPGIDPKYFDRIFELFQTLRPRDELEGSGMGLSVVIKHLHNLDGKIEVESDGHLGCLFRVLWPKHQK